MFEICCGRPLRDVLTSCAILDLFLDNIQIAVVFISQAFPQWLPDSYYKAKVYTLQPTFDTSKAPVLHKPQEDPQNPANGESHFILFLTMIGLLICLTLIIYMFYWLWTGAREINLSKCQRWLCARIAFLSFLILITIYKLSTQNYYAFDGLVDALKIYTLCEIFMLKKFIDTHTSDMPILPK